MAKKPTLFHSRRHQVPDGERLVRSSYDLSTGAITDTVAITGYEHSSLSKLLSPGAFASIAAQFSAAFPEGVLMDPDAGALIGVRVLDPEHPDYPETLTPLLDACYRPLEWMETENPDPLPPCTWGRPQRLQRELAIEQLMSDMLHKHRIVDRRSPYGHENEFSAWVEREVKMIAGVLEGQILLSVEVGNLGLHEEARCSLTERALGKMVLTARLPDGSFRSFLRVKRSRRRR